MLKKIIKKVIYFFINIIEKIEYKNIDLDENDINKKILNTISNLSIDVNTDNGIAKGTDIHITQPYTIYNLELENGYKLECADTHIVFDHNLNQIYCKDLNTNIYLYTDIGISKIKSIKKTFNKVSMFDLTVNNDTHRYYTNGILSHNTINAAITMLHFITFNVDKNIMIVANKRETTTEIVDKIKSIYVNLPFFLKIGVKNWNVKTIVFENGCKIKTAARSKEPAIGFTLDFLYLDEFAHIPSNIIGAYYKAALPTLASIENSRMIITSTPNGMNLFYDLLNKAQKPANDDDNNGFAHLMVYWHQVPGRHVTFFRLYPDKLMEYEITKEELLELVQLEFPLTKVDMNYDNNKEKYIISVHNSEHYSSDLVKQFTVKRKTKEIFIQNIAYVTTWKEEAIKEMNGEDAFNQEYDLRFVDGSRSLLDELVIDKLIKNKRSYLHTPLYEFERRLKFDYKDLTFIDDNSVFIPLDRNKVRGIISIDIAAGGGGDYSVINMFKIRVKPPEAIEQFKHFFTDISDFFCLEQFGMYSSNLISVEMLAQVAYVLAFEYLNPDNFKIVLEYNTYGEEFLEKIKHVFDDLNNYSSGIFFRYKHRADSTEERIGLRIKSNKEIIVKDYQIHMNRKDVMLNNSDNVDEITRFVKQISPHGNVTFAADTGHDDKAMTVVNLCSVFDKHVYKEMVENFARENVDAATMNYFRSILKNEDIDSIDYKKLLNNNINNFGNTNMFANRTVGKWNRG